MTIALLSSLAGVLAALAALAAGGGWGTALAVWLPSGPLGAALALAAALRRPAAPPGAADAPAVNPISTFSAYP